MDALINRYLAADSEDEHRRLVRLAPVLLSDVVRQRLDALVAGGDGRTRKAASILDEMRAQSSPGLRIGGDQAKRDTVDIPGGACRIGRNQGDEKKGEAPRRSARLEAFKID